MVKGPDGLKMSAERQWGGPGGGAPPGRSLSRVVWGAERLTQGTRARGKKSFSHTGIAI